MIYSIPDYQHRQNLAEVEELKAFGFEFQIGSDSYFVSFKGQGISGASVANLGYKQRGRTYKHRAADFRENVRSAVDTAKRSKFYEEAVS